MKNRRKLLPLGIKKRTTTELPALVALAAVGQPWFSEQHLTDLMVVAMVSQLASEPDSEVHRVAMDLFERLGRDELVLEEIRPLVLATNEWIQRQPNGRIQDAIDRLMRAGKQPNAG
ncbi:MAG: hypothetical protein KF778_17835 [Rhodocyclaceae bacterium]|nr:hypothetical protein [Rhodocyclaceae bacterium]MBX3670265.1 hypothetical protein [Rhodocyclaceae bacterium]